MWQVRDLSASHLQSAHDALISSDTVEEKIKNINAILKCLEAVSGLKINFTKTKLFRDTLDAGVIAWRCM